MQIFVLGMHRSGTSMVTRLVNMMGVYLGDEPGLVKSTEDNPQEYWEPKEIVANSIFLQSYKSLENLICLKIYILGRTLLSE